MKPSFKQAAETLGLELADALYPAKVKAAWAAGVKAAHSDTAGTDDAKRIEKLTEARDVLLKSEDEACTACRGVGKVRGRFGSVDCGACKGTGDKSC